MHICSFTVLARTLQVKVKMVWVLSHGLFWVLTGQQSNIDTCQHFVIPVVAFNAAIISQEQQSSKLMCLYRVKSVHGQCNGTEYTKPVPYNKERN